jgi:hypothetical protein
MYNSQLHSCFNGVLSIGNINDKIEYGNSDSILYVKTISLLNLCQEQIKLLKWPKFLRSMGNNSA